MFPLSHIYVSTKVAEKENDFLVLGSVIPDLAWFSMPLRGALHNEPKEFWDFVKAKYPDFLDLALGIRLHSQVCKGVDFYSDDETFGYAKINGRIICNEVETALRLSDKKQVLTYAHSFIEAAVDLNLNSRFSRPAELYENVFKGESIVQVSTILGEFLKKDGKLVKNETEKLMTFFKPENRSTLEKMATNVFLPFLERVLGGKPDYSEILGLLDKSRKLTQDSFLPFLDETVKKMKVDFKNFL